MMGRLRRFIIRTPIPWYARFKLHRSETTEIVDTIVCHGGVDFIVSYRKYKGYDFIGKDQYRKRRIDSSKVNLSEYISEIEYNAILSNGNIKYNTVRYKQYGLYHDNKHFTVNIYSYKLKGLTILSTITEDRNKVSIPQFLESMREITLEPVFDTVSLSQACFYDDINKS